MGSNSFLINVSAANYKAQTITQNGHTHPRSRGSHDESCCARSNEINMATNVMQLNVMYTLYKEREGFLLQYHFHLLLTWLIYIGNEFAIYFINLQCQTAKTLDAVKAEHEREMHSVRKRDRQSEKERERESRLHCKWQSRSQNHFLIKFETKFWQANENKNVLLWLDETLKFN